MQTGVRNVSSTVDPGFTAGRCSAREGAGARAAELISSRASHGDEGYRRAIAAGVVYSSVKKTAGFVDTVLGPPGAV